MKRKAILVCIALHASLWAALARAQSSVVETPLYSAAERKIGYEYRKDLNALWQSMKKGEATDVQARLQPVLSYCDAQQRPGRRLVSVATTPEYEQYMAENANGVPTEWIDIACPTAYYMTGYLHAGARRWQEALPWLERASALAPYFPDPRNERGFVLGQSGRLPEALASYRETLALAERFPNAAYIKPLALRGQGWVLIEMGDLDGAQRSYEASLELDPDSPLAKQELEYIAQLRSKPR